MSVRFIPETPSTNDWIRMHAAGLQDRDRAPGLKDGDWAPGLQDGDWAPGLKDGDWAPGLQDCDWAPGLKDGDWAPGLKDGDWIVAGRQTAGRGRQGRAWEMPAGNLAASCLILPAPAERPLPLLSFVAALALHDVCAAYVAPARLLLKWPNDLLLDGAKLSGILLEAGEGGAVVLGVGVNLAAAPDLPDRPTAALLPGGGIELMAFAKTLADALQSRRRQWRAHGFAAIRADWMARAHQLDTPIAVSASGAIGRFAGLADDGALRLSLAEGMEVLVHAGDIFADLGPAREAAA